MLPTAAVKEICRLSWLVLYEITAVINNVAQIRNRIEICRHDCGLVAAAYRNEQVLPHVKSNVDEPRMPWHNSGHLIKKSYMYDDDVRLIDLPIKTQIAVSSNFDELDRQLSLELQSLILQMSLSTGGRTCRVVDSLVHVLNTLEASLDNPFYDTVYRPNLCNPSERSTNKREDWNTAVACWVTLVKNKTLPPKLTNALLQRNYRSYKAWIEEDSPYCRSRYVASTGSSIYERYVTYTNSPSFTRSEAIAACAAIVEVVTAVWKDTLHLAAQVQLMRSTAVGPRASSSLHFEVLLNSWDDNWQMALHRLKADLRYLEHLTYPDELYSTGRHHRHRPVQKRLPSLLHRTTGLQ
eukprot:Lankesteria_metandrocarpae@DN1729_c0_g1_i1.p1